MIFPFFKTGKPRLECRSSMKRLSPTTPLEWSNKNNWSTTAEFALLDLISDNYNLAVGSRTTWMMFNNLRSMP